MTESTLNFTVEGIGEFTFLKRTLNVEAKIEAETIRMTGGPTESFELRQFCRAVTTLRHLLVTAPEGWSLEEADPLDPAAMVSIKVFGGLRKAEDEFRQRGKALRPKLRASA